MGRERARNRPSRKPYYNKFARCCKWSGRKGGHNMVIRKETKEYRVTERRECWVLSCTIGGLSVEYKVPKDICANEEELRAYVEAETLF